MNQDIISEIRGVKNIPDEVRLFLLWLVNFEKENIDRDRFAFKQEIENSIKEFLKSTNKEKND